MVVRRSPRKLAQKNYFEKSDRAIDGNAPKILRKENDDSIATNKSNRRSPRNTSKRSSISDGNKSVSDEDAESVKDMDSDISSSSSSSSSSEDECYEEKSIVKKRLSSSPKKKATSPAGISALAKNTSSPKKKAASPAGISALAKNNTGKPPLYKASARTASSNARLSVRFAQDTSFTTRGIRGRRGGRSGGLSKTSLAAVAPKILHAEESKTESESLLAALLKIAMVESASRPRKTTTRVVASDKRLQLRVSKLEDIAKNFISLHNHNHNRAEIALVNLLFRSVGGHYENCLDHAKIDLESTSNVDWEAFTAQVCSDMENTPVDRVLLCSDPLGAVHADSGKKKTNLPQFQTEFRELYADFWYHLSSVAVADGLAPSPATLEADDSSDDMIESSDRFQLETACSILHRMVEYTGIGQPDIRAAATLAVYQMSSAMLERVRELERKLDVAERQLKIADRNKSKIKAKSLQSQINRWSRGVADLTENVKEDVFAVVFGDRYKDKNPHIRAMSLETMARFAMIAPAIFLKGSFMKYLGFMLLDADPNVRLAAVQGLTSPLQKDTLNSDPDIDTTPMQPVYDKFRNDIVRRTCDVDSSVQESAIDLILLLMRQGFLENVSSEDPLWNQVNLRALDPGTTYHVRKQALYFIIEQLHTFSSSAFDKKGSWTEAGMVAQLDDLAQWISFILSGDSGIQVEHIRYHLVDLVVNALRSMDEHEHLVTNWKALLRCLEEIDDKFIEGNNNNKQIVVKKRVVLRMIVCAAELEFHVTGGGFMTEFLDQSVLVPRKKIVENLKVNERNQRKNLVRNEASLRVLTDALLEKLPDLFVVFKGEEPILESLTSLPQYLSPLVFSEPSKKLPFSLLLRRLSEVFLECTNENVLDNCALSLITLARYEHARKDDALARLQKIASTLRDRFLSLIQEKAKIVASTDNPNDLLDVQSSLSLCLRRFAVLARREDISLILPDRKSCGVGALCDLIGKDLAGDLQARQKDKDGNLSITMERGSEKLHTLVVDTLKEGLQFLLVTAASRLFATIEAIDKNQMPSDLNLDEHEVLIMRERLLKLLSLCFAEIYDEEQVDDEMVVGFSKRIQGIGAEIFSDMKNFFPQQWEKSQSPFLRECALSAKKHGYVKNLVAHCLRFTDCYDVPLQSDHLRGEDLDSQSLKDLFITPARSSLAHAFSGNRFLGACYLTRLYGHGPEASRIALQVARIMKRMNIRGYVEAHYYALTNKYENWLSTKPFLESNRPSEEEVEDYEEKHRAFVANGEALEALATRLASTLGVGRLSNKELETILERFFIQCIDKVHAEESLFDQHGVWLGFFRLITKYIHFARKMDPLLLKNIQDKYRNTFSAFHSRNDIEDFNPVDLKHIDDFGKALGVKVWNKSNQSNAHEHPESASASPHSLSADGESEEEEDDKLSLATKASSTTRKSTASKMSHRTVTSSKYDSSIARSLGERQLSERDRPFASFSPTGRSSLSTIGECSSDDADEIDYRSESSSAPSKIKASSNRSVASVSTIGDLSDRSRPLNTYTRSQSFNSQSLSAPANFANSQLSARSQRILNQAAMESDTSSIGSDDDAGEESA